MKLDWQTPRAAAETEEFLSKTFEDDIIGEIVAPMSPGGRTAALENLRTYDVTRYGSTRNYLRGKVSKLSPYLRHGMLSITEVREHIQKQFPGSPHIIEEFLRQLAWRDFFDHVLDYNGAALQDDLEPAKHSVPRDNRLPLDIVEGKTGLPCMDAILDSLFQDGYLHNHERLWFAAYFCHFRGLDWKAGAMLFRQYLLDGDWASNSASWQWVESTFATKTYYMNQENIAKFSENRWCESCRVKCPFRASYEQLQVTLFDRGRAPLAQANQPESPRS